MERVEIDGPGPVWRWYVGAVAVLVTLFVLDLLGVLEPLKP